MSSKAARRRAEFLKREAKRQAVRDREKAFRNAKSLEEMAAAMGIKLK